ncbi:MAG: recombination protein RecR [Firmicutes bacterium]|nr:recombination protein RecR [Bacillota bacterium]
MYYAEPVAKLIGELSKLPGVGPKTAERLAFHLIAQSKEDVAKLTQALKDVKEKIHYCSVCFNITEQDPCRFCQDPSRDSSVICVVEQPKDIIAMEKTREYRGRYHVLLGSISPMDGVGPDDIRLRELLGRLEDDKVKEVIVATSPTIEGEATAMYVARLVKPLGVRVTRIAHGLPVGGSLEYVDEITLAKALEGRREL